MGYLLKDTIGEFLAACIPVLFPFIFIWVIFVIIKDKIKYWYLQNG